MPRMTVSQYQQAKRMWAEGATLKNIAHATGCRQHQIKYRMERNRSDFPRRNARVMEQDLDEAREMRERGMSYRAIGRYLGLNYGTIHRRLRGDA